MISVDASSWDTAEAVWALKIIVFDQRRMFKTTQWFSENLTSGIWFYFVHSQTAICYKAVFEVEGEQVNAVE